MKSGQTDQLHCLFHTSVHKEVNRSWKDGGGGRGQYCRVMLIRGYLVDLLFLQDQSETPHTVTYAVNWRNRIRDLQDSELLEIASRLTDPETLKRLAAKLNVQSHTVESALTDSSRINDAAHRILRSWFLDQMDKRQAFETMCKALESIGKNRIIVDVLITPSEPSPGCSTNNYCS